MIKKIRDGIVQIGDSIIVLESVTIISQDVEREIGGTYNRKLFVNGTLVYDDDDRDNFQKVKNSLTEELKAFHRART